ncbi:hypothetical protein [Streptomyces sp. NPDC088757]|uniref:hypothetical protein n=1 Tax=Streptomyces sp. NPDC088757 TaxID=3365889 RepID=UPI00380D847A
MTPPRFACPVPEHLGACVLETGAARQEELRIDSVGSAVVVRGAVTDTLLTSVRDCHPTRYVTLDYDTIVIWPATLSADSQGSATGSGDGHSSGVTPGHGGHANDQ